MNVSLVIGNNIKKLMEKENVSLRKLSEAIEVTHPTLKKYVDGLQPIDSEKLIGIARYFGKPFDYFFKEENKEVKFLFRAEKAEENINNLDVKNLENTVYNYLDIIGYDNCSYIPQKYNVNYQEEQNKIYEFVAKIALEQRRLANVENNVPDNYFKVISDIGVNVIVKDFNNDGYFGASFLSLEYGTFILINDSKNISEERKIFSLIHEYAHLLFHSNEYSELGTNFYKTNKSDLKEKIADKFAGYFLMPKHLVDSYLKLKDGIDPYQMKRHFQVSLQTLYYMLYEYKYISKDQFNNFWKKINIYGLKDKEPEPLSRLEVIEKNDKLFNKIKELYLKEEIGASKISELLSIDNIDTRKILKEWRDIDERYLPLR